jgi:pimeloyl-CoA synthetase
LLTAAIFPWFLVVSRREKTVSRRDAEAQRGVTTSQVEKQDANPKNEGLKPDVPERSKDKMRARCPACWVQIHSSR